MTQTRDAPLYKRVLAFGRGAAEGALIANTFPYAIASYNRWSREWKTPNYSEPIEKIIKEEPFRIWRKYGELAGGALGLLVGPPAQALAYNALFQHGYFYTLALPFLTNAASYLYERHRARTAGGHNPRDSPTIDDAISA